MDLRLQVEELRGGWTTMAGTSMSSRWPSRLTGSPSMLTWSQQKCCIDPA
jgi:hypothetical protein